MSMRVLRSRNCDVRLVWADSELTLTQAARQLGMSIDSLRTRAVDLKLPPRRMGRREVIRPYQEAEFRVLWLAGVATREIATAFGCSRFAVLNTAARLNLPARGGGYRPRLTLDQAKEVKLRLALEADAAARRRAAQ